MPRFFRYLFVPGRLRRARPTLAAASAPESACSVRTRRRPDPSAAFPAGEDWRTKALLNANQPFVMRSARGNFAADLGETFDGGPLANCHACGSNKPQRSGSLRSRPDRITGSKLLVERPPPARHVGCHVE